MLLSAMSLALVFGACDKSSTNEQNSKIAKYEKEAEEYRMHDYSPLHMAAYRGDVEACKIIIDSGEDVDVQGAFGKTPLVLAVKAEKVEAVKYLIDEGADVNIRGQGGQGPLHAAV